MKRQKEFIPVFRGKMGVEGLETFENLGKFTKDYVKLTKIGTQRLKKYAQCWKVLEGFCQVAKNR